MMANWFFVTQTTKIGTSSSKYKANLRITIQVEEGNSTLLRVFHLTTIQIILAFKDIQKPAF
jgi:hypothetical protein